MNFENCSIADDYNENLWRKESMIMYIHKRCHTKRTFHTGKFFASLCFLIKAFGRSALLISFKKNLYRIRIDSESFRKFGLFVLWYRFVRKSNSFQRISRIFVMLVFFKMHWFLVKSSHNSKTDQVIENILHFAFIIIF